MGMRRKSGGRKQQGRRLLKIGIFAYPIPEMDPRKQLTINELAGPGFTSMHSSRPCSVTASGGFACAFGGRWML